MNRFTTKYSRT